MSLSQSKNRASSERKNELIANECLGYEILNVKDSSTGLQNVRFQTDNLKNLENFQSHSYLSSHKHLIQ
jgi:hypothetical protein